MMIQDSNGDELSRDFDELISGEEKVSIFGRKFPTQPVYKQNFFLSKNEPSQINLLLAASSSSNDTCLVLDKIKSLLCNKWLTQGNDMFGLAQFWAPSVLSVGGRRLLTCIDLPFAIYTLNSNHGNYRLRSVKYKFHLNEKNYNMGSTEEDGGQGAGEEDDRLIINDGPPARVFLNHMPEFISDISMMSEEEYPKNAFSDRSFESMKYSYMAWPIFKDYDPSCVGVLEFILSTGSLKMKMHESCNFLKSLLKEEGLRTFDVEECLSSMSIDKLGSARHEIEKALVEVCKIQYVGIAQAWIRYERNTHDRIHSKQAFALRLVGVDNEKCFFLSCLFEACKVFPLKLPEGLVGKAFLTHERCFCENISTLSEQPFSFQTEDQGICGFVICLMSTHTGNLDYVLEFLWKGSRGTTNLLDKILLTLKSCLQSFKVVSGEDASMFMVKARYGDDTIICKVSSSSISLVTVKERIATDFNLDVGVFKLKYLDEANDLISILNDEHLKDCIKSSKISNGISVVVHPNTSQV